MMRQPMWNAIDGETIFAALSDLADVLPGAARVQIEGIEMIIADYALWKHLVLERQSDQTEANHV